MNQGQLAYELVMHVNSSIDRQKADLMIDSVDWNTYLANPIKIQHNQRMKVSIESIEIPNTAYTFPIAESVFWWIKNYGTTNTLLSLNIPLNRNFLTSTDLVSYLNTQMSANSYLLVFSYDQNTNKLTVTNNETNPIRIVGSYRFGDTVGGQVIDNISDRFGFISDLTTTGISNGSSLTGQGILRLLRSNCYYLACDFMGGKVRQSNVPNTINSYDICARVSSGNYGSISQLRFGSTIAYNVLDTIVHKMHFTLLDDQLQPITLNGSPITFSMKFSVYN